VFTLNISNFAIKHSPYLYGHLKKSRMEGVLTCWKGGIAMPELKYRPISLTAIFYDIIFTFVIGRLARTLLFTNAGQLDWRSVIAFGIMMLCSWTVWTYQVIYASRAPKRALSDNIFMTVDLFLSIYLTTTLNIWGQVPNTQTKVITALLFFSLAVQYLADGRKRHLSHAAFIGPLLISALLAIVSLFPGQYYLGNGIYVLAIMVAALGPWLLRNAIPDDHSHFGLISQRLALMTVLLFGRSIVQVTDSLANLALQPVLFFIATALIFASYALVSGSGIDANTHRSSMLALLLHLPLNAAVLMMANVTRVFVAGRLHPEYFAIWMLVLIAIYVVSIGAYLLLYRRTGLDLGAKRGFYFAFSFAILALYGLITVKIGALFLIGFCAFLIAEDLYLWQFVLNPPNSEK
jgi:low temperature requirement protein LtrA